MTLTDTNHLTRTAFVETLGWVFEHSPWVPERAWERRPFANWQALHAAMTAIVRDATRLEQEALLRAHPDLGTRARMSEASAREQAGAGIDRLEPEEFDKLQSLNAKYREKFGFPFLFAVRARSEREILRALEERLQSTPEAEFQKALSETERIARFRLSDMFQEK